MKLHLPSKLMAAVMATMLVPALHAVTDDNIGNVMYVGDSITHGVNSASWRWAMHKIFTDNGISYTSVGYKTGNYSGGVGATANYGGATFQNAHSSQASARAWEISGRANGSRFDGTNIKNWLGQSSNKANGQAYTGSTYNPDAFYLLIGTNDLLSDGSFDGDKNSLNSSNYAGKFNNLLGAADANGVRSGGDMKTILDSMYAKNPNAPVTILSIPCWTNHANNNGNEPHQLTQQYNEELAKWVDNYNTTNGKSVLLVDVNKGMVDVASDKPFYGCASMFGAPGSDGLHPSPQGDLIMAGAVAKAQGYAGRTAGQERKSSLDFDYHADNFTLSQGSTSTDGFVSLAAGGTATLTWEDGTDLSSGYTVTFTLANGLGDGALNGWDTSNTLSISLGDGRTSGTLSISEAYIKWGDKTLYSMDMSGAEDSTAYTVYDTAEALRVAYVQGNTGLGLDAGYYVWLGDMLIGEACSGTDSAQALSGISLTNGTGSTVTLGALAAAAQAYAPTTGLYSAANPLFKPYNPEGKDPATMQWSETAATTVTLSGNMLGSTAAAADGYHIQVTEGSSASNVYGSNATVSKDLWVEISGSTSAGGNAFCGVKQGRAITGDVYFRVADTHEGTGQWGTWFGALNGGTINGNLYMEFSSANWDTANGTSYGGNSASVAGSYGAGVSGKITMVFNAGTFRSGIWGGNLSGNNTIGSTDLHIYGGTIMNNIHAGSAAGTISGDAALTFTGENYSLNEVSKISAGGTGGTINGGTTLTIDGMNASSSAAASGYGISGYTGELSGSDGGTVRGTRTLAFKGSVHEAGFGATLSNFDRITFTNSNISLGAGTLGGATLLELDPNSTLTLTEGTYENVRVSSSGTLVVNGADLGISAEGNDSQVTGTYKVQSGSLGLGNGYITQSNFTVGGSGTLKMGNGVEMRGSLALENNSTVAVDAGATATVSGALSGSLNHNGEGKLVLATGTEAAPVTLTGIAGSNIENTGAIRIAKANLTGTVANNGTMVLTGVRGQTFTDSHLTGNGKLVIDKTGSGHIFINMTTASTFAGTVDVDTTGYWFYFNGSTQQFAADDEGRYASLHLKSDATTPNFGLAMGSNYTHDKALAIGSLSGDAGVAVSGDFTATANVHRFLDIHQDTDTTFAGKFLNNYNAANERDNSVGIIKHGTGNLTLTAANESTAALEIEEGTVTLAGENGNWAGNVSVTQGAKLVAGNETVTVLGDAEKATINGSGKVSVATADRTYTNADIVVDAHGKEITTAATLSNSKLTVLGGSVSTKVEDNTTNTFDASEGDVTVETNEGQAAQAVLNVSEKHTVTFTGDVDVVQDSSAVGGNITAGTDGSGNVTIKDEATLTVGRSTNVSGNVIVGDDTTKGTLAVKSVSAISGNLTVKETGTITFSNTKEPLNVAGTITLENEATLDLTGLVSDTLTATSVSITLAKASTITTKGNLSINGLSDELLSKYKWALKANGTVIASSTPRSRMAMPVLSGANGTTQDLVLDLQALPLTAMVVADGSSYNGTELVLRTGIAASTDLSATAQLDLLVSDATWYSIVGSQPEDPTHVSLTIYNANGEVIDFSGMTVTVNGVVYDAANGTINAAKIPEPATGTLSVLALAALAMRRRRKS